MRRRTWVGLTVSGLVVAGVAGAIALVDDGPAIDPRPSLTALPSPSPTGTGTPTSDPSTPAPTPSTTADPGAESLAEQIVRVAGVVEQIRGLQFTELPEPTVLSPDALAARVREQVSEYTAEDADLDSRLLSALGVVAPGTDVRQLLIDAYGEQVAGYYDPETGELVVGAESGEERLGRVDELTLAHELEHALADQTLGLPIGDEVPDGDEDEAFARQALVEGDATVTMSAYVEVGFTQADRLLLLGELQDLAVGVDTADLPYLLQRQLEFPYVEGANFVASLVNAAGWAAVDAAYEDPPASTAAILEPQRYVEGFDTPDPPAPRGSLTAPWERVRTVDIGAADLLYLFEAPGDDPSRGLPSSRSKALAWTGGTLDQWRHATDTDLDAFGFAFSGDWEVLCQALDDWYSAAFPDAQRTIDGTAVRWDGTRQDAVLRCGGVVRLGIGPDGETAFEVSSVGDRADG